MRSILFAAALAACSTLATSSPADDAKALDANRALGQGPLETAWNTHDMEHGLRAHLAKDVVWISVSGGTSRQVAGSTTWSPVTCACHASPKFKDSVTTVRRHVDAVLLKPDVGPVHVIRHLEGDRDNDGTLRPPRDGVITWATVVADGAWKIRASQNTNTTPVK